MSDIVERLQATKHGLYWDVARDAIAEVTRLRTLLSEAEQRGNDARVKALEEAAKVAETGTFQGGFQTRGDERRAFDIARRIRALQSEER